MLRSIFILVSSDTFLQIIANNSERSRLRAYFVRSIYIKKLKDVMTNLPEVPALSNDVAVIAATNTKSP